MPCRTVIFLAFVLATTPLLARQQEMPSTEPAEVRPFTEAEEKEILLWRQNIEGEMKDISKQLKHELNLDEKQYAKVKKLTDERISHWFSENEERVMPPIRGFYRIRKAKSELPDKFMSEWARQSIPIWQDLFDVLESTYEETRPILEPAQRRKLEEVRERSARDFERSMKELRNVESWYFDPEVRKQREEEKRQQELQKKRADQVKNLRSLTIRMSEWEAYVHEFCTLYELDDSQIESAYSILKEVTERADAYIGRRKVDLDQCMKKLIEDGYTSEQDSDKAVEQLLKPIDDLFAELDHRLNRLPTTAQVRLVETKRLAQEQAIQSTQPGDTPDQNPQNTVAEEE